MKHTEVVEGQMRPTTRRVGRYMRQRARVAKCVGPSYIKLWTAQQEESVVLFLRRIIGFVRNMFRRSERDNDLDDEIRSQLALMIDQKIAEGMAADEARRAANIELGGVEQVKEQVRAVRTGAWLDSLLQDIRFGLRMLRKSPGFTTVAVLTLALGIGANAAIFSVINGLMLHTLPIRDPGQLVELLHHYPGEPEPGLSGFSWDAYRVMRDGNHVLSKMFVGSVNSWTVRTNDSQPETVFGGGVDGTFFEALGLRPAAGRLIGPEDVHAGDHTPVAVVSWSFWKSRFDLNPGVIGQTIVVNDNRYTIIGVAQRGFYGLSAQTPQDIWIPVLLGPAPGWGLALLGQLKPGVSIEQARAELAVLFQGALNGPDVGPFAKGMQLRIEPAGNGVWTPLRTTLGMPLTVLMGVVGLLLLLACANLAGLLLARAASRQQEMAVRVCLGAGRARLIQQTLTESLLLSVAGSALGIFLAQFGARGLIRIFASGRNMMGLPIHFEVLTRLDWRVLLFAGLAAVMTAVLFGAAPAMRAWRPVAAEVLQQAARIGESKSQRLFGKGLVVSQVALSVSLLSCAALFVGYLSHLRNLDPGFRRDHLLLVTLDTTHSGYSSAQYARLSQQLLDKLGTIPGVKSATLSSMSPMEGPGAAASAFAVEHPDNRHNISINNVAPGYFETYGTPLLAGRYFSAEDQGKPVVLIMNQAAARECFGNENPIGKHLTLNHATGVKEDITYEVVGVVGDAKYNDIQQSPPATVYRDLIQEGSIASQHLQLAIRTAIAPDAIAGAVRETETGLMGSVPIMRIMTMNEQIDTTIVPERLVATLSGWFSALGALLAAIGLYGLLAYTVTRRTHEIGVRMALGAGRTDVMKMVLRDSLWMVCTGLVIGAPLAFWGKSVAASLIPNLPVNSPIPIVFGGTVMIALGLLAAYMPARKAMRVDPMVALRHE